MRRAVGLILSSLIAASAFANPEVRPKRTYDLLDVSWFIDLTGPDGTVSGLAVNTVRPFPGVRRVWFDAAHLTVAGVSVDGRAAKYQNDGRRIWVDIPAAPPARYKIAIKYAAKPEAGLYFVPADRAFPAKTPVIWTQGEMEETHHYIPTYDYPDDKATSEGRILVPKGWKALSNGNLVGVESRGANDLWHWRMDLPHSTYLISTVAGPYSEIIEQVSGPKVSFWVPPGLEDQGGNAFYGTAEMIRIYGQLTGFPYPYAKYSQSAVPDFTYGGMENITSTTQTITALFPKRLSPLEDATGLVAHELAHQWFGDTVTTPNWAHIWVNEGWASFMPHFITRSKFGKDRYDLERADTLSSAYYASGQRPMIYKGYTDPIENFDGMAYAGGAARMFMLMHLLGEDKFWAATKSYLHNCRYQNVDTERFFAEYTKATGVDLDGFRKQWFYRKEAPRISLKHENGEWFVTQPEPYFTIPTEVLDSDGRLAKFTIAGPRTRVPSTADLVIIDPDAWQMIQVTYADKLSAADAKRLYLMATNDGQKSRLIAATSAAIDESSRSAIIRNEPSVQIQSRWIDRSRDAALITEFLGRPNPFLRQAAASQAGDVGPDADMVAALRRIAETEANDNIRISAMRSLWRLAKDPVLLETAWNLDGHQETFRTWALNTWAGVDADHAREIALAELANPRNEALRTTSIRVLGRVKDKPGERGVYDALVKAAQGTGFAARQAAIGALAQYGDPQAIAVLTPLSQNGLVFIKQSAKAAIETLKRRNPGQ